MRGSCIAKGVGSVGGCVAVVAGGLSWPVRRSLSSRLHLITHSWLEVKLRDGLLGGAN